MGPDTLAHTSVPLHLRARTAWCNGTIRALAKAGIGGTPGTGMVEATKLATTAASEGGGHVTRPRKITDKHGHGRESEVTVDGWTLIVLREARTKIPLAVTVGPIHEHAGRSLRALVTQAQAPLAGLTRLHQVVCARGCLDGVALWWLDHQGITFVVPATEHLAVTVEARAHAAAGEGITGARRVHTGRHGQGHTAWPERRETEVVGITGLPPADQDGTLAHGRSHTRRAFEAHPIHA